MSTLDGNPGSVGITNCWIRITIRMNYFPDIINTHY